MRKRVIYSLNPLEIGSICNYVELPDGEGIGSLNPLEIESICNSHIKKRIQHEFFKVSIPLKLGLFVIYVFLGYMFYLIMSQSP